LDKRINELPRPKNPTEARAVLSQMVDRATARLEEKAEACRQHAALLARLTTDRLSFDDSPEGERLRRYEATCGRSLSKAVDSIAKMRLVTKDRDSVADEHECGPTAVVAVEPEIELVLDQSTPPIDNPTVAATPIAAQAEVANLTTPPDGDTPVLHEPTAIMEDEILRNEPGSNFDEPILRNEPGTDPEASILRNEPGTDPELPTLGNETGLAADEPILPNEFITRPRSVDHSRDFGTRSTQAPCRGPPGKMNLPISRWAPSTY
jgi:hypothetical protein